MRGLSDLRGNYTKVPSEQRALLTRQNYTLRPLNSVGALSVLKVIDVSWQPIAVFVATLLAQTLVHSNVLSILVLFIFLVFPVMEFIVLLIGIVAAVIWRGVRWKSVTFWTWWPFWKLVLCASAAMVAFTFGDFLWNTAFLPFQQIQRMQVLSKHQSTQSKCHRSSTTRRRSHYLWSQCWSWSYDDWMLSGYHHLLCSSNYISHWEGWASSSFTVDQLWSFHDRHWLLRMSWGIPVWRLEPTWRTVRWFARNRSEEGKVLQIGHRGFLRYLQENCEISHLPSMAQWTWGITPQLEVHSQLQSSFGVDHHSFSDCGACCDSQRPFAAVDVPTDCGTAQTTYWRWHAWPYGSKIIAVDVWLSERRAGSDWTWLCHLCAILKPTETVRVANVTLICESQCREKIKKAAAARHF